MDTHTEREALRAMGTTAEWYTSSGSPWQVAFPGVEIGNNGAVVGHDDPDDEVTSVAELDHPAHFAIVLDDGNSAAAVCEGTLPDLARTLTMTLRTVHDLIRARERAGKQGKTDDAQTVALLVPNGRRGELILPEGVST